MLPVDVLHPEVHPLERIPECTHMALVATNSRSDVVGSIIDRRMPPISSIIIPLNADVVHAERKDRSSHQYRNPCLAAGAVHGRGTSPPVDSV